MGSHEGGRPKPTKVATGAIWLLIALDHNRFAPRAARTRQRTATTAPPRSSQPTTAAGRELEAGDPTSVATVTPAHPSVLTEVQ
jgi:hypothetical protein